MILRWRLDRRWALWTVLCCAGAAACAVSEPPSGGPQDKTPPTVAATSPAPDSAGVAANSAIEITFSEKMTRSRLERLVVFSPPIEFGRVHWKDHTIIIQPAKPLNPDTTYLVQIRDGFQDSHRVRNQAGYRFAFATSAAIDSGTISGTVRFHRKPTKKAVVRCFLVPRDTAFVPAATRADREGKTNEEGLYRLGYLPTRGNQFVVWAFEDADGNDTYSPDKEWGAMLADTVTLSPKAPFAVARNIDIIDPTEPGVVRGKVTNESGIDTVQVSVWLDGVADTTLSPLYTVCDDAGAFVFQKVKAGRYRLSAFIDLAPDSLCGTYPCADDSTFSCVEPCAVYPDTVVVGPGDEVALRDLVLPPADPRREKRR